MKKTISILIVAILIFSILTVPALAYNANKSFGDVPKSSDAITVDGVKDAIYDQGLQIPLDIDNQYSEGPTATRGNAWLLWQDGFLYVFVSVTDSYIMAQDADTESNSPWMTDSVEVFLDPDNNSEDTNSAQFRIDAYGYRSFENRFDGTNSYGGDATTANGVYDGAAKMTANGYDVEFKLPITKAAGAQIGLMLQINDMQSDDTTRCMVFSHQSVVTDGNMSWNPIGYDYIVLSATAVTAAAPETTAAPDTAAPAATDAAVAAPSPAPAAPAPATGDTGIIFALIALVGSTSVLVLKSRKNRA
ncbi:MAG: hypothetical protein FWD71_08265 [Oscillospiraceae bacterium]|nr:hypothetical protein [Oscillospiraceae bacterium]